MMERYGTPAAVESAIAAAAKKAHRADPSLSVNERIRLEYFHRFLSRVFDDPVDAGWVLKGGTGMLARVASARATTDLDLFRRTRSLDRALDDLRDRARAVLDDFFRFEYTGYSTALKGERQAYTDGCRVGFDVYIGVKKKGTLHVDLVVGVVTTDDVAVVSPAHALDLPKLPSNEYRLYPIVDQIADKVCATLALYGGRQSTREKDLVDLVLIATTQEVRGSKLRRALEVEARVRGLALPGRFTVPRTWGPVYAKLARDVPACEQHPRVGAAMELMRQFIDPVLADAVDDATWDRGVLGWR